MNDSLRLAADCRSLVDAGDDDFSELGGDDRQLGVETGTNSLLRVDGLYKLESMVGFCDHRLDKRSGTRLVSLAPSSEKRQS